VPMAALREAATTHPRPTVPAVSAGVPANAKTISSSAAQNTAVSHGTIAGEGWPANGMTHGITSATVTDACVSRLAHAPPGITAGNESMKGA